MGRQSGPRRGPPYLLCSLRRRLWKLETYRYSKPRLVRSLITFIKWEVFDITCELKLTTSRFLATPPPPSSILSSCTRDIQERCLVHQSIVHHRQSHVSCMNPFRTSAQDSGPTGCQPQSEGQDTMLTEILHDSDEHERCVVINAS